MSQNVGLVQLWIMNTLPYGFLPCEGALVSRTTYADLFAAIGTTYGVGDGSTTFALPDYRGYFARSYAGVGGIDPEASSRTDRGDGTTGDVIGTKQANAIKTHTHNVESWFNVGVSPNAGNGSNTNAGYVNQSFNNSGGNESRPINIYIKPIIKY